MQIAAVIEHHPSRAELLPDLVAALAPLDVEVVEEDRRQPTFANWVIYRRALEAAPVGSTHVLVLQDDAQPCERFVESLEAAVLARPDDPLVLCVVGNARAAGRELCIAHERGDPFVTLYRLAWMPAVAVVWPVELVERMLALVDHARWPVERLADDGVLWRALVGLGVHPVATVPSIVEHPDEIHSVDGRHKARNGRDLSRVAVCFDPTGEAFLDRLTSVPESVR